MRILSYIPFILILTLTVSCLENESKTQVNNKQLRGVNHAKKMILKRPRWYHEELLDKTPLTEEQIAQIKSIEQTLFEKYASLFTTTAEPIDEDEWKSIILYKKHLVREALNDDILYLKYAKFDENYKGLASKSKGSKK